MSLSFELKLFIHLVFSSEHDLGEDDIYDCVPCEDDGDDIYEDIIKVEVRQPMVRTAPDTRSDLSPLVSRRGNRPL